MKREKTVSFTLTEDEHRELSVMVAKRIATERRYVTLSAYVRDLVLEHIGTDENVSTPPDDTFSPDTKQKNSEWKEFEL